MLITLFEHAGAVSEQEQNCHVCLNLANVLCYLHGRFDAVKVENAVDTIVRLFLLKFCAPSQKKKRSFFI
ncbi:hypothetical protein B1NLA3E_20360 [Bacillus sp. 1NLA3E]|nr:hypothetical protein B1NLA3E_20360 [Bacillus sp. 1NLA3E]